VLPAQTPVAKPVIVVGVVGILVNARVLIALNPQALLAVTPILPETNSDGFTATVMVLVVDVPVKPAGKVQV
jgi:hypothetical protein